MTISMGKKYRTRDGREVRFYAWDGTRYGPIHGAVKYDDGWQVASWYKNGKHFVDDDFDLIEVKTRIQREYWVNLYPANHSGGLYDSKTRADLNGLSDRLACVKIIIDCEEGEGL